jgi:DNA-binding beta-propeller fold protein YncE
MGFNRAIALALGEGDTVYVLNRGAEQIKDMPWNRTQVGARVGKFTIGPVPGDEEPVADFGRPGDGPGQFIWPAGLALDSQENVYVTDEWLNRVSIFDQEGTFLGDWGTAGSGDSELYGPSGLAIDPQDVLYIVDGRNHRVQKFTKDGKFLSSWGGLGSAPGQFNAPWGITLDQQGHVYVADHKNHRVQKFTPEGQFLMQFGSYGTGTRQLNRPSAVAVDPEGDIYVCDWANHRVQIFDAEGKIITGLRGDAQELSKWAKMALETNPGAMKRRREVRNFEQEWRFAFPTAVVFDAHYGRLIVCDTQRNRLQIYNKVNDYQPAARTI